MKGRENLEDLVVDWRIILQCILYKYVGRMWTGFILLRIGFSGGYCKHGNEPSVYKRLGIFVPSQKDSRFMR
jgi:hypothetical protein